MRLGSTVLCLFAVSLAGCLVGGDDTSGRADAGIDLVPDAGSAGGPDADPGSPTPDAGTRAECYTEPAYPGADISDIVASYGGAGWKDELIDAIDRRWPAGAWLLDQQRDDDYFDQFSDPSSWSGMVGTLDTLVHEETHLFNAYHAIDMGEPHALYFREDLILYPADLGGFPRSEIRPMLAEGTDDIYADTYLTGSQGERGFTALLDELTAYTNELAAVGLVGEYYPGQGVSLRDGSVAFLYFLQLYLNRARTEYPDFYDAIQSDPVYQEIVKTHWLRTHYFLELADEFPELGIHDAVYREQLYRPENLAEIDAFLGHTVGESNCLLD